MAVTIIAKGDPPPSRPAHIHAMQCIPELDLQDFKIKSEQDTRISRMF